MTTNRATLSDTVVTKASTPPRQGSGGQPSHDSPRRMLMVVGGFIVALVSLAIGSVAIAQVWLTPAATDSTVGGAPFLAPWESMVMIVLGGLGFAAGAALVGIGVGRWTEPHRPKSEADYTGPGHIADTPEPPKVV